MIRKIILLLLLLTASGCASVSHDTLKLEPGMSKQQIISIMGEPTDRSFRGTDEAWQYQDVAGFGQCEYVTVWIAQEKLVGVSSRRGSSIAGCGLGSRPIDWRDFPNN